MIRTYQDRTDSHQMNSIRDEFTVSLTIHERWGGGAVEPAGLTLQSGVKKRKVDYHAGLCFRGSWTSGLPRIGWSDLKSMEYVLASSTKTITQ